MLVEKFEVLTVAKTNALAEAKRDNRLCDIYNEAMENKKDDGKECKETEEDKPRMICWFENGICTDSNCKFVHPEKEYEQFRIRGSYGKGKCLDLDKKKADCTFWMGSGCKFSEEE